MEKKTEELILKAFQVLFGMNVFILVLSPLVYYGLKWHCWWFPAALICK